MTTITSNDITIHYRQSGSGPPLILLHGLAEDHRSWSYIQAHLPNRTIYAVDLRGHGATTPGQGQGLLSQLGQDLIGFMEQVTGPAAVVGFSLGGTIVLWAAAERPDLMIQPIPVATSSIVGGIAVDYFNKRIAQLETGQQQEFAAGMRADSSQQSVSKNNPESMAAHRLEAVGDGQGYINAAKAMIALRQAPLTPRLSLIKQHVDLIGADSDIFCPRKAADIIIAALPQATYHEIAGSGHLIAVDQPQAFTALLTDLL